MTEYCKKSKAQANKVSSLHPIQFHPSSHHIPDYITVLNPLYIKGFMCVYHINPCHGIKILYINKKNENLDIMPERKLSLAYYFCNGTVRNMHFRNWWIELWEIPGNTELKEMSTTFNDLGKWIRSSGIDLWSIYVGN